MLYLKHSKTYENDGIFMGYRPHHWIGLSGKIETGKPKNEWENRWCPEMIFTYIHQSIEIKYPIFFMV